MAKTRGSPSHIFAMFKAPRFNQLPHLAQMIYDLPATQEQIAELLGITIATLRRYAKTGNAPRSVYFALFWETHWGRSACECEAANFAMRQKGLADALQRELDKALNTITRLEQELSTPMDSRAANQPIYKAR